ncbi:MAG: EF-P lysine aminoacylase EpmA [bacterium]
MLREIRLFFSELDVLEVETPILGQCFGTDPAIEPFRTQFDGPGFPAGLSLYLQSSPEYAMKRLLASGSGPIYQVCKAFRQGEHGVRHNPEFSMLEWYRPGFDSRALMEETTSLCRRVLKQDLSAEHLEYRDAFLKHVGIDPLEASLELVQQCATRLVSGSPPELGDDRDAWLDLLMSHVIEPRLGNNKLTFVCHYPVSQAALARVNPDDPRTADRFELYYQGIELANGFHELTDSTLQRQRFELENETRSSNGQSQITLDDRLLDALEWGMSDCSGIALGLDRLLMLATGASSIKEVISFPLDRC